MITCPTCSLQSPDGTRFCHRCGTDLGGSVADERLVVQMAPARVAVAAGGTATASAVVRNLGTLVAHAELSLSGSAAAWSTIAPTSLRILPGEQAEATVSLSPPRTGAATAGAHPLILEARGAVGAAVIGHADAIVDVAPFDLVAARVVPRQATRWHSSKRRLELTNAGNAAVAVSVRAFDDDDALVFTGLPPSGSLPPGPPIVVAFQAQARAWRIIGKPLDRAFSVSVTTTAGTTVAATAIFRQRALITLATVLGAFVVFLFLLLLAAAAGG